MSNLILAKSDSYSNTLLTQNTKINSDVNTAKVTNTLKWEIPLQRLANNETCKGINENITVIPNKNWHNSSIVLVSANFLISNGLSTNNVCLCIDEFRHNDCPITTDSDLNIGTWREFGCGCDDCDECVSIDFTNDYLDCSCECQIPSKIATLKQKKLSNIKNKCIRDDCACTSTWNGLENGYCCNSCKKGQKCLVNKHPAPPPIKCDHCGTCVYNIRKHLSRCKVLN